MYHYTSVDAFLKLIDSKVLWASDLSKMNDPNEFSAGIDIIEHVFIEMFPRQRDWLNMNELFGTNNLSLLLGCSFTNDSDNISHWRAYGDDGAGVSIGLDKQKLNSFNTMVVADKYSNEREVPLFNFCDVIYSKNTLQRSVGKILEAIDSFPLSSADDCTLSLKLLRLAYSYKSEFYSSENEVRVIFESSKNPDQFPKGVHKFDLNFRMTNYGLTAYRDIKLGNAKKTAIFKIILGPKCRLSVDDVSFMLLAKGIQNVDVRKSRGKYR